ncbi:MAG: TonB-dependent receptor [Steroidobacteraceae bacterium]
MRRKTALALAASIPAAVAALCTGTARAAAAADEGIEEVVITAQFREQNLQQTPIAITAVTAEMLEMRSQNNLAEIASQAPNVTLRPLGGSFGPAMGASIRGIGQFDFNPAMEPGVGIYVDDVYYASLTGATFELLDLERVEILRGPQGSLAGKNSIGGSVRLVSKKPQGDNTGYLSATYGIRNRMDLRASGDFTLVDDKLFMRLSGVSRSQEGYVTKLDFACANPTSTPKLPTLVSDPSCVLGKQGGRSYQGLRAMLRYVASDALEVTVIGDRVHDDSEGPPVTLLSATDPGPATRINGVPYDSRFIPKDPYVSYATFNITGGVVPGYGPIQAEDRSKYDGWGLSAHIDWKLGDSLNLKSITGTREFKTYWSGDPDVSPLPLIVSVEHLGHEQFSQELRLTGQAWNKKLDYTAGVYYSDQTTTYANRVSFPFIGLPGYDFIGDDPVDSETQAAFLHSEWHLTDRLNVTAGVRYTKEEKTYNYTRLNPDLTTGNPAVGSLNGRSGKYEGNRTDWRLGADFQLADDSMVYAQVSTGFKGGGVNPRPYLPSQVQPFNPEEVTAYEIGSKNFFFDRRLRLNVSTFFSDYKDIQLLLIQCPQFNPPGFPLAFPCAAPQNAGDAEIKGVELETEFRPVDRLSFDASLSYIDFGYTRIDPQAGGPTRPTGPQIGDSIPNTPEWKYSVGVQYEALMGNGASFTPRLDYAWQDKQFASVTSNPLNRIGAYGLLNARIGFKPGEDSTWEGAFEVTNVTDEFYYVMKLNPGAYIWAQPSRPREWALTVKKTFR